MHAQDVQLQNAGAWGALASAPDAGAAAVAEDGAAAEDGGGGGDEAPGETDALWDEFQSREQQQKKRDEEKRAQEARLQEEKAKVWVGLPGWHQPMICTVPWSTLGRNENYDRREDASKCLPEWTALT